MAGSLQERLEQARRGRFVGREAERDLLREALAGPELPFFVLHLFGPGGIGKTSLMREFAYLAQAAGARVAFLDGRGIDAAPDFFLRALAAALRLPAETDPVAHLADAPGRLVLLVDTYEVLTPIDGWLREQFLSELPADTLVILAGRRPPSLPWRTDPGWAEMMRILPLRNFNPEESRAYLARRHVPADQVESVLDFTHGHALALSLVADLYDQGATTHFRPEVAPNVIQTLLEQLVQQVPSPAHRAALEGCALVRLTTESLLAELLSQPAGSAEVHDLFEWLRGLSFMEADRRGIFPHDLTREALLADVRWRNPDWYGELHARARRYYMPRVQAGSGQEQRRLLSDYVYLHRDSPSVKPFFLWQESGTVFTDGLRPEDVENLAAMVEQHEGDESAALAVHWLDRQPEGVSVLRGATGEAVGFLARVRLEGTTAGDRERDPAVRAAWDVLARQPSRAGETATLFRFWMARDTYQGVSPEQSRIFLNMVQHYLATPGLAYTFLPCADPIFWQALLSYADQTRLPEADFTVGGRHYGVYAHDWRVTPPLAWLELMAAREMNMNVGPSAPRSAGEPLIVLSEVEFATAVRDALRDYTDVTALTTNPLLRSRLVLAEAGPNAPVAARAPALRRVLRETCDTLQESPRLVKFHRALYHTYFQPAATQEQAAEVLDLPFSTYRRHLRSGIEELTSRLWSREMGNLEM
ncbi:ATP-binding protein [Promineifilum sp.]|uniref:ATP-binding protein n=1 Tax=Promineifilum sp. TaxID=2664178 RepID=UPI0035AEF271